MSDKALFPRLPNKRRSGEETFFTARNEFELKLHDYWSWAHSAIASNVERGIIAEFLVGSAIGAINSDSWRDPWADFDISWGEFKIEVKSAAYIQDWPQPDYSKIQFTRLKSRKVDDYSNVEDKALKADLYVLCLQDCKDHAIFNILDLDQWKFWILTSQEVSKILGSSEVMTLSKLDAANLLPVSYLKLQNEIEKKLS